MHAARGRRWNARHLGLAALVVLAATVAVAIVLPESDGRQSEQRRTPVDGPWQYQLQGRIAVAKGVRVLDVDGESTSAATVRRLQRGGRYVICYMSAGSSEDFRSDHRRFPEKVMGEPNGWPGERWLDIRRLDVLGPILEARMRSCARKGFDAVEPDNVDGYADDTGFPLTRRDALRFTRWLARTAHGLRLAIGLKNALELVPSLAPAYDFAVVEQCFEYDECGRLAPFARRRKPVYEVEYAGPLDSLCPKARRLRMNSTLAPLDLDGPGRACPARRRG